MSKSAHELEGDVRWWEVEVRNLEGKLKEAESKLEERKRELEEAKRDAAVVANFFNSHAQALTNIDPDFHRDQINAFVEAARIVSGRDRT